MCSRARTPSIPPGECSVAQPPDHFTSPPLRCPTAQASHNHHTIKPSRYHENAGDITSMKPFPGRDRVAARSREKVWMLLRDSGRDRGGVGIYAHVRDTAAFCGVGRCPMSRSGAIAKTHSDVTQTRAPCCLDLNSRNPMQARMLTESMRQLSHFQGNRRVG